MACACRACLCLVNGMRSGDVKDKLFRSVMPPVQNETVPLDMRTQPVNKHDKWNFHGGKEPCVAQ